jgi:hypothetical protein
MFVGDDSQAMGGRLALVIGSECEALATLGFIETCAKELYRTLVDLGDWEPCAGRDGPIIDPTALQFTRVVTEAFAEASSRQATLLLSFIGHGLAHGDTDYFLLASDSSLAPMAPLP